VTCGLNGSELVLLYYLFRKRCLSEKHTRSILAMERDLASRIDVEGTVKSLVNKGYMQ